MFDEYCYYYQILPKSALSRNR